MAREVITIGPGATLVEAAAHMRAHQVGALAVVEDDRLVGIITERDLLRTVAEGREPAATAVAAGMTVSPRTIGPDEPAEEAARIMIEHGVRHLPVVEGERMVGFISARDLLWLGRSRSVDWRELTYEPW